MTEREQLEQAIAALEAQRSVLGDEAVDAALVGPKQRLQALGATADQPSDAHLAGERASTGPGSLTRLSPMRSFFSTHRAPDPGRLGGMSHPTAPRPIR